MSKSDTITIFVTPKADFSFNSGNDPRFNDAYLFNNESQNFDSSQWNFGDNTFAFEQNPMHRYINAGNYTITLIVTSIHECRDTVSKRINDVNPLPDLFIPSASRPQKTIIISFMLMESA